jgi:predicted RNA-binding protein YlxR (DUF448 family)
VIVDLERRRAGRGAYVCPETPCIERALGAGGLGRVLRRDIPDPDALRADLLGESDKIRKLEGADG